MPLHTVGSNFVGSVLHMHVSITYSMCVLQARAILEKGVSEPMLVSDGDEEMEDICKELQQQLAFAVPSLHLPVV